MHCARTPPDSATGTAKIYKLFTLWSMRALRLSLGLLVVCATVALVGPVWEARQRAPELAVREYLSAVEREDLDGALQAVVPEQRASVRERIENQLGNHYRVDVLALGRPSLLERARGVPDTSAWATILGEVTTVSGERWKSTSVVRLVEQDGRWYLLEPPFA